MVRKFGFGRNERLKSRKAIDHLFTNGKSLSQFPLRVMYFFEPGSDEQIVQAGVTVSKRNFKKAVDRNRIKRQMREAYRLNKKDLLEAVRNKKLKAHLFFMYMDKASPDFTTLQDAMQKCLVQLKQKAERYEDLT